MQASTRSRYATPRWHENTVADNILSIIPIDEDWVYTMQKQDPALTEIFDVLKSNEKGPKWSQVCTDHVIEASRLLRKTSDGNKLVVPQAIRWRITKANHDDIGHYSTEKTV